MDNGVIHAAAGSNKRKSNSFLAGAEDLKENVKGQRVWTSSRLDDIVGLKSNNAHNVVNAQRSAVDWMPRWTTTPHQKPPQMPSALSPVLNYGAMAAAALQDLRAIDPPNHFYQPQKPPQRQQQPQLQSSRQHLPAAESSGSAAGLLQEVSVSALLPQSPPPPPVRLPPLPLIRTPAAAPQLYNESDLHNSSISPTTSSCSSPYTSLQQHCNMIQALPHSHNTSTSSSLQEFSNEQTYSTLLQTSQNGTTQQQQQHQLQSQQQQQQQQQLQQHQQQPSSWFPERNNTIQKELQQVSTTSWYPSIRTASASPESQSVASSSRLQRMDTPTVSTSLCAPQIDTQTLSGNSSIAELGNQVGFSNAIQCSNQRVYRDAFTEQDQQAQFDHRIQSAFGGGGLGLMGAPKRGRIRNESFICCHQSRPG
ncbi:hypothetical protein CY35_18G075700 [Sphagnum magellanicum]|nr:hypothetical protein CY35_18G075700 [Sphagnum magellanicum]